MKRFILQSITLFVAFFLLNACSSDSNPEPDSGITQDEPFTDSRDGKEYKSVKVGNKRWMGENLKYATPSAGTSTCYDDNNTNCTNLGRLYDFQAAQVACPNGWHLPTDQEWKDLETILGIPADELNDLESRGTDEGAELINGVFKAEKSGRETGGVFVGINVEVNYWTSTEFPTDNNSVFIRYVDDNMTIGRLQNPKNSSKLCVRCVEN
ncbi:MAG: FISUMP domain-containing protein [Microscillaceae bacterium]|nr:FISUMP domain-containing protein [Microscillaceae bacterium]